jgi:hypothetical protein
LPAQKRDDSYCDRLARQSIDVRACGELPTKAKSGTLPAGQASIASARVMEETL